jgi:hypothetical protein
VRRREDRRKAPNERNWPGSSRGRGPSVLQNLHSGAAVWASYAIRICYFPVEGLALLFNGLSHLHYLHVKAMAVVEALKPCWPALSHRGAHAPSLVCEDSSSSSVCAIHPSAWRDCLENSWKALDRLRLVGQEDEMGHLQPVLTTRYVPRSRPIRIFQTVSGREILRTSLIKTSRKSP